MNSAHRGDVRVWDAATGAIKHTLQNNTPSVTSAAWNPDGFLLASGSCDRIVRLWDMATDALKGVIPVGADGALNSVA